MTKLYPKYDAAKAVSAPNALITAAEKEFDQQLQNLHWYNTVEKTKADELLGYLSTIETRVQGDIIDIKYQTALLNSLVAAYNSSAADIENELSTAYWMVKDYKGFAQYQRNLAAEDGSNKVLIDSAFVTWLKA